MVVVAMSSKIKVNTQQISWRGLTTGLVVVVIMVALVSLPSQRKDLEIERAESSVSVKSSELGGISGKISTKEAEGISYYHCAGMGSGDELSLVLLHGAKFTKEDWKTPSGILEDLCKRETQRKINVFAVDLPVQADHKDLMKFLDSVADISKPVSLVTPSASGKTMVTWSASTTVQETLPRYIKQWIPVAAIAVNRAPDDDIRKLGGLSILAIYGNRDIPGKESSERLKSLAGARILEQVGGHPCYLDSPKEFVSELVNFLK